MRLSDGYKLSEIGVIPIDWEVKTLGSLTTLLTNGFVGTATTAYVDDDDGILYVQGYNIEKNSFNFNGIKRVSKEFHAKNNKSCLKAGDLLTIQTGDVGVTTVVPPDLAGANCHALIISRFRLQESDPFFYSQYFNSEQGRAAFKVIETGTTMKHLNGGDMKRIFVPVPPFKEQQAIAKALSDIDELLATIENAIAKKRDLKQAVMEKLLTGEARLPNFKSSWETKSIVQLCKINKGQLITTKTLIPGNIPVIAGGKQPAYFHSSPNRFGKTITISASGASAGYIALHQTPIFASDCSTIEDSADYCLEFIYYSLLLKQESIYAAQTGGAQPHVNAKDIYPLLIALPTDISEQKAIAAVLSDMDLEIFTLEEHRQKTSQIKLAMMQELLTGKTRLVNKEHSNA